MYFLKLNQKALSMKPSDQKIITPSMADYMSANDIRMNLTEDHSTINPRYNKDRATNWIGVDTFMPSRSGIRREYNQLALKNAAVTKGIYNPEDIIVSRVAEKQENGVFYYELVDESVMLGGSSGVMWITKQDAKELEADPLAIFKRELELYANWKNGHAYHVHVWSNTDFPGHKAINKSGVFGCNLSSVVESAINDIGNQIAANGNLEKTTL